MKPEIKIEKPSIPIQIELGGLPLSIGFFAASGLTFLLRGALPKGWPKTTAFVGGAGLAVAGIVNLVFPKAQAQTKPAPAVTPSGAAPAEASPGGFVPPSSSNLLQLQVEMLSPQSNQEIEHTGGLFAADKMPVVLRLYNPTPSPLTFNLEFEWDEFPSVIGYNRESVHGSQAFQVSLGPGEEKNQSFDLPVQTSMYTALTVGLSLFKKRTPEENRMLVLSRTFSVT